MSGNKGDGAGTARESVLNRAIDCRTRETILSSLHRATGRNFVPRICARALDGVRCEAYIQDFGGATL